MRTLTKEIQEKITPAEGMKLLREGNRRFVDNLKINRNLLQQVNDSMAGQHPFAVVLSCIDSRTSAELIFDQGLGDIFSVRIAGNVLNNDILGSLEFSCLVAGAKVVLVVGHTRCGAVKGACDHIEMGHLTELLGKIQPAINLTARPKSENGDAYQFANAVAETNVHLVMDEIVERSDILRGLLIENKIAVVGGMYDIETGRVKFFEHPELAKKYADADLTLEISSGS